MPCRVCTCPVGVKNRMIDPGLLRTTDAKPEKRATCHRGTSQSNPSACIHCKLASSAISWISVWMVSGQSGVWFSTKYDAALWQTLLLCFDYIVVTLHWICIKSQIWSIHWEFYYNATLVEELWWLIYRNLSLKCNSFPLKSWRGMISHSLNKLRSDAVPN